VRKTMSNDGLRFMQIIIARMVAAKRDKSK
jgi:hypothetical protein